jgi:hypothetical protein
MIQVCTDVIETITCFYIFLIQVPVYDGSKHNVCGLLLVKRLIVISPEDKRKIGSLLCRVPSVVGTDTTLLDALNVFQEGKSHIAIVCNKPEIVCLRCLRCLKCLRCLRCLRCFEIPYLFFSFLSILHSINIYMSWMSHFFPWTLFLFFFVLFLFLLVFTNQGTKMFT